LGAVDGEVVARFVVEFDDDSVAEASAEEAGALWFDLDRGDGRARDRDWGDAYDPATQAGSEDDPVRCHDEAAAFRCPPF
jgi:hypothetical protein